MKMSAPRAAAVSAPAPATTRAAAQPDQRATTVAQRQLRQAIEARPRQVAQRQQAHPNKTGLPDQLKAGVENLSGHSLDDVRVHYNSAKPAQLQALAYAQGTAIHVAPGQEHHLPHEAWHVVQQKQGRVRPTMQLNGVRVNDHHGLEAEADAMGARAGRSGAAVYRLPVSMEPVAAAQRQATASAVVQKAGWWDNLKHLYSSYAPGFMPGAYSSEEVTGQAEREKTLRKIQQEQLRYRTQPNVEVIKSDTIPSQAKVDDVADAESQSDRPRVLELKDRKYQAIINTNAPIKAGYPVTDSALQSAETHELTHIVNDHKYLANNSIRKDAVEPMLNSHVDLYNSPDKDAIQKEVARLKLTSKGLTDTVQQDDGLGGHKKYIEERINYMASLAPSEMDSVTNELTHYMHLERVPATSETSKRVVALANERYEERNKPSLKAIRPFAKSEFN